ncbi:MAG: peptidase M3, partial [Rikenellaceae bacterium]|nr:peptidase M3 [Rikenellaceae bacterium]
MKKSIIAIMSALALAGCCEKNPLLQDFDTPFQTPPFDKIKVTDYMPAFERAVKEMKAEAEAIAASTDEATFENTVVALEQAGSRLTTISNIFFNLREACTSPEMDSVAVQVQPMLTQ